MSSKVLICNQALGHLGISSLMQSLDEKTTEALAFRTFYNDIRDTVLRDFNWPFAKTQVNLALKYEYPNAVWRYGYAMPTKIAAFRRIESGVMPETESSKVPFEIGYDGEKSIILTNQPNAVGEYTAIIDDPALYTSDFRIAFSHLLASTVASMLTAGDPTRLKERLAVAYQQLIARAKGLAQTESQPVIPARSEWIRIR